MMRWELVFEGYPPSPNDRMDHWKRARLAKAWRTNAGLKALQARIPMQVHGIRISARFLRRRLGVADEDNDRARLKNCVDGIVDAGVIRRDTRKFVQWGAVTEEHGDPGFVLIIEALEERCVAELQGMEERG